MIPMENLGLGKMGFILCDFYNNPMPENTNSEDLPLLSSVLPGDLSDSRNSCLIS